MSPTPKSLEHKSIQNEKVKNSIARFQSISPLLSVTFGTQFGMLATSDTMRHVVAGSVARTMAQTFIHPIDTIKTRLQVRSPPKAVKSWKKSIKKNPIEVLFNGKRVIRIRNWLIRGPKDVYLGVTGSLLGTLPVGFAYFTAYEGCKSWLESTWDSMKESPLTHVISTSVGGVVSCVIKVPTDTIRHRVQAYVHPNVFRSASAIVKTEGVRGLYAGFLPTLLRDVPELALQFTIYERLRHSLAAKRPNDKLYSWEHLVLGGLSGAVAATVTMPFDVAKTTIQCGTKKGSMTSAMMRIYQEKGTKGLFAGLAPRVTQVAVNSAAFFALYEFCKMSLKPKSVREADDSLLKPKIFQKPRKKIWKRLTVVE